MYHYRYIINYGQACAHCIFQARLRTRTGREPVRDWLHALDRDHRKTIGGDIKTLQYQWPVGMPLTRKMEDNLWELRSHVAAGIARTFFTLYEERIVLLHGFVKKSRKTPAKDLAIARLRLKKLRS